MINIIVTKYGFLLNQVYYQTEGGYRWEARNLPDWIYFTITEDKDTESKVVTVYSKIHMNKEVVMNPTYSNEFSNHDIIKDISARIWERFIK